MNGSFFNRWFNRQSIKRVVMILPPVLFVIYIVHGSLIIRELLSDSSTFHLDYAENLVQDYLSMELALEVQRLESCIAENQSECKGMPWITLEPHGELLTTLLIEGPDGTAEHQVFLEEKAVAVLLGEFLNRQAGLKALFTGRYHEPVYWARFKDAAGEVVFQTGPPPSDARYLSTFPLDRSLKGYQVDIAYTSFGPRQLYSVARSKINFSLIFLLFFLAIFSLILVTRHIRQKLVLARQKTFFVNTVSHEFKTPLAIMKLSAETLQAKRFHSPEEERKFQRMIINEINRLDHLVHKVLSFNRIEMGQIQFHRQKFDLRKLLGEGFENFRMRAAAEDVALETALSEEPCWVFGDPDLIRHAFDNILDNAFKYRGETKAIRIECGRAGGECKLSVRDFGVGIPRDEVSQILKSFYRVDNPLTRGIRGSGLGLAVAHFILKRSRARLDIESEPGQGSLFTMSFPYHEES